MSLFARHRWFIAAAGVTLACAGVSLFGQRGPALTLFADLTGLVLMLAAAGVSIWNAVSRPGPQRSFWALMALGFSLWATNQLAWTVWENVLHRPIPDPFFYDIVLFIHAVPMIAAVGWRPDLRKREGKILLSLLSFLMLLGWWVFLYAFVVFPHQYVLLNTQRYNLFYDQLYGVENGLLLLILALAAWTSSGGWRGIYTNFLGATVFYAINSQLLDRAAADNTYYSGSLYDVPLLGTVAWMAATAWSSRSWDLKTVEFALNRRWKKLVPQLAMLAILSLPMLGLWTVLVDGSHPRTRSFRLVSVLCAMLFLGAFVFLRQYMLDHTLMSLLEESRRAYDGRKELQNQLVQREKLASLGKLIAGAAHEIEYPLGAVMDYSEQLWGQERLSDEQGALVRKIVNQARRTRDLVTNLLSFAQQTPAEKMQVDLAILLQRAVHVLQSQRPQGKIKVRLAVQQDVPKVLGNPHQLFQGFVEIIENSMDALDEAGGGLLEITAERVESEIVLQFSDNGTGIREPQRVFDPFYTTKPVGKGTGLGLSAVYGMVQDHGGHISCKNKPEGGALFVLRLPAPAIAQGAGAS